jgi:hypothetical protein
MRQRILGGIGVVWGGALLLRRMVAGPPAGQGAYAAGQNGALVFAVLLLVVGLYYLIRKAPAK